MRAERLGSYSIVVTVAGIPAFSRLKSIMRSFCLCPPPRCQLVMSPELRRPPVRCFFSTSGLCGCCVVISSLTIVVRYRSVCVVGRYVLIAINLSCHSEPGEARRGICFLLPLQILRVLRHLLPGPQPHISLLPVRTVAGKLPAPPLFPRIGRRAHGKYFDLENRLHRLLDLGLRSLGRNLEHQRVLVFLDRQPFFRDHRTPNNLICGFHHATSA